VTSHEPAPRPYFLGKRFLDLMLLAISCPIWLPLLIVVTLLLWLFQGQGVLFRQERLGLAGVPFTILKFRTMIRSEGEGEGAGFDGERLTRAGRILRRTSLDELPGLLNVLRGEMSLVGPRPLLPQYLGRYSPRQGRRHEVRPGVTGWAQVNGRNALSWEQKFELDVWYVEHLSLVLDLKILGMTLWKIVTGEGLSADGHATMPEFMGNADE
jgi:sugar transferase EpsL